MNPNDDEDRAPAGRVILTYGRSLMALAIARSLALRGVEVIGCDDVDMTVLSFSRHVRETFALPSASKDPDGHLQALEEAVQTYAPRDGRPYVLMPAFRDVALISRHRERFEPAIAVAAPRYESIIRVSPKHNLAQLAEELGLPAPRTVRLDSLEAVERFAATARYPLIVKPDDGAGGRGVSRVDNAEALRERVLEAGFKNPPLIQDCVEGEDYCVAALMKDGEVAALMAYLNLATFPREAGAGAVRETVEAAPFRDTVARVAAATRWNGVAQFDFRWSGRGEDAPQLIEINARFWAGVFHSIETGVDFPWLLFCQTAGIDPQTAPAPKIGARTKTPGVWLLSAIEDVAASDPHLEAARHAWRRGVRAAGRGDIARMASSFARAAGASVSLGDALARLDAFVDEHRGAPSELSADEDPLVGLGALFVLSSLARHGKLPPEVTYKAEEDEADAQAAPAAPRKRPRIGVTMPDEGETLAYWAIRLALWLAGADAVRLRSTAPLDPHSIDGLVLGGGSDVYPALYAGRAKQGYRYDLARSDMEASWAAAALRNDLPVLGICRGAQMLNVLAGGTLAFDLSGYENATASKNWFERLARRRRIWLQPRSKLAGVFGRTKLRVNSIHTQAIDQLGAGLKVAAREANGVIQAIEDRSRRFWIGVQFHPELLIYRAPFRRLFKALAAEAKARAQERVV